MSSASLLIADYRLREVLDSRGLPTIEAEIYLEDGSCAQAIVPSGASTGTHEAVEKRDGNSNTFLGKSVRSTIDHALEKLAFAPIGINCFDQRAFDTMLCDLDGTPQKNNLGANVTLALSLALARAASKSLDQPLFRYLGGVNASLMPVPFMNIINGGAHADNGLDIQEFMVLPVGFKTFRDALQCGSEIYHHLKNILKLKGLSINVGDEGGFAPNINTAEEALDLISEAVLKAGYKPEIDVVYALDAAASEFYISDTRQYRLNNQLLDSQSLINYYSKLCTSYPIASIEDGLHEDSWDDWKALTASSKIHKVQIVGDDLFVTNVKRIQKGTDEVSASAVLIKPNQIGTLTETINAINLAKSNGLKTIISHRSGESEDTFIADLAVAFGTGQIKTGAPCRSERTAKYNQLLRIGELLGEQASFQGRFI